MPSEKGRLLLPHLPFGQHYVHPGVGGPLPSKDIRRDPRQRQRVQVILEESPVPQTFPLPGQASTRYSLYRITSSLGGATIVAKSLSWNVFRSNEAFAASFPPRSGKLSPEERAATATEALSPGTEASVDGRRTGIAAARQQHRFNGSYLYLLNLLGGFLSFYYKYYSFVYTFINCFGIIIYYLTIFKYREFYLYIYSFIQ